METFKLDSGKALSLTPDEKISIELQSRNTDGLRHLLNGGLRLAANPSIEYKITSEDLEKITQLSVEEKQVADTIHEYFNTMQKDKLNEESRKLNGWEIATEPDYFPIRIYGQDIKRDSPIRADMLPADMRSFVKTTIEGQGWTKERTRSNLPIVIDGALSTTYKSIKQTSAYYGLASPLRTSKAILFDKEFRQTLNARYPEKYWNTLRQYVADMEGEYQRISDVDEVVSDAMNRLSVAVLGLNPFVIFKQPISLLGASTEIDGKYLARAIVPTSREIMSKYSPQTRDRIGGMVSRELGEIAGVGQSRKFWTKQQNLSQGLMSGIARFDLEAIGRIWKAAEFETKDLHPSLEGDAFWNQVASRAEEITRKTQPTFHIKDRSEIGRNKDIFIRLVTKFTSQRNKNYMMAVRAVNKYNNSGKTASDRLEFSKKVIVLAILMPALLYGVDEARNLLYGRKEPKRIALHRALRFSELLLGNVYFVGNIFRSAASFAERGEFAGFGIQDVLTSTVETGAKGIGNLIKAIAVELPEKTRFDSGDKAGQLKWKNSMTRAVNQLLSTTFKLRGIPFDTAKKLITVPFREDKKGSQTGRRSRTSRPSR